MFKNAPKSSVQLLSDHSPFIARSEKTNLMGWNILCQMQFNTQWNYFNNGFNCLGESDELYSNRLSHIVSQIGTATQIEKPDFICLQECPENEVFRAQFDQEIKQNEILKTYNIEYFNNAADKYYLMTMYNSKIFTIEPTLSHHIAAVDLKEGFAGRILPIVFIKNDTKEPMLVINVHANFSKTVANDVKALYEIAKKLGINQVVIIGDFNRDLVLESDNYSQHDICRQLDEKACFANDLQAKTTAAASFCSKYDKETKQARQKIETRDGLLSSFSVKVRCMPEINTTAPKLRLTKEVSPDLNRVPYGLLERAERTPRSETDSMHFN